MAIGGSCLCGEVRFEVDRLIGPFEICHCTRCRKSSGSTGMPAVGIATADFRWLAGKELIDTYDAPILYRAPAYHAYFCRNCGSPLPPPDPEGEFTEIPAGLFDDDIELQPDKHIFVEFVPDWDTIADDLPTYTIGEIIEERTGKPLPDDFQLKRHGD